jgi:ribosomal protein S27AE
MTDMLTDLRLDERELALLAGAAMVAGAELDPDYMGEFRPADQPRCVALRCTSPGQLITFSMSLARSLPAALLGQLAARVQEDGPCRPGARRAYYWPGVLAPEPGSEPEGIPAMLKVAGKRFACERCGATVFTRHGEVFACNGCSTQYEAPVTTP